MVLLDQEVKVVRQVEGKPFYDSNLPNALRLAQAHAGEAGYVASMPQLLHGRTVAPFTDEIWNWYTANSEEDVAIDLEGRFGKKERPVVVVLHGGGILGSPDRIDKAYADKLTGQRAAKFSDEEARAVLEGKMPDGKTIPVMAYNDFVKATGLPVRYGLVLDFDKAKSTKSGHQKVNGLYDNPLVIARAGGVEQAKLALDRAKEKFQTDKYGNWHPFNDVDPKQAQGRLLFLSDDGGGLNGNDYLNSSGRFAGVAPEALSASTNGAPVLEERVKSALDAGQAFEHKGALYVPVSDKRVNLDQ